MKLCAASLTARSHSPHFRRVAVLLALAMGASPPARASAQEGKAKPSASAAPASTAPAKTAPSKTAPASGAAAAEGVAGARPVPAAAAPEPPLYDQAPFDVIVLDEANGNLRLKVAPLPLPKRRVPNWNATTKFTIRLLDNDDEEYEVSGGSIRSIELYETMLIAEGRRLMGVSQGRSVAPATRLRLLDEAFHHFYRVHESDPNYPGLKESINQYLFLDAGALNAQGRFPEAMAVLDELYSRDAGFVTPTATKRPLGDVISLLLDRMLGQYFSEANYAGMRTLMRHAARRYGAGKLPALAKWADELKKLAASRRDEGRALLAAAKYREAFARSKQLQEIWPEIEGAREFSDAVAAAYPMIFVGVTQPALDHNAESPDNWGARRTGRLVHRTLVEFLGAGPEGGQYQLSLGAIDRSEDNRQLILRLDATAAEGRVTGYDMARRVLELATPQSPDYVPAWAALMEGVSVNGVYTTEIKLRRPHVLPEGFLRVPLHSRSSGDAAASGGDGEFRVQARTDTEIQFAHRSFRPGERLAELVEVTYDASEGGLAALRRGDIDVLDRVFPADALRVRAEASADAAVRVEPYALPTVHLLVPNPHNPFLAQRDFRRAILLGIDRETILRQEVMGGRDHPGFQVISGPFPASAGESDPLGYAYDENLRPLPYSPLLARVLTIASRKLVTDAAEKRGEPPPELNRLLIGHPGYELARVSCQAIATQLQRIGLKVELREFPPGVSDDRQGECDLVYKDIALWEPVTDARRILGPTGVAPTQSPYVQQSLRWLDEAENWSAARERLIDIHRAVYNDAAVLPLWQTVDFFAYDRRINNIGSHPVWLYQNVDQWRIGADVGAE